MIGKEKRYPSDSYPLSGEILKPSVSIIIPAFNEEKNIDDVLIRTYKALESCSIPYEIIVVDDGSKDRTRELAFVHKVTVVCNEENAGKGAAFKLGFEHANGDIIVTMDADGSHDPDDIPKLVTPVLRGATMALGTRFSTEAGRRSTKRINLLGNMLFNLSISLMTGRRVADSQCGFRAFKRSFLEDIEIVSDGFDVETELLLKALKNGNIVEEVALNIRTRANGHSNVRLLRDGINIMRTILLSNVANA